MLDLTLIAATADPAALYDTYCTLSRRYDEADAQLDQLQAQLDALDENEADGREHIAAEMDRLANSHTVLLGWVSVFFAAYTFARRGVASAWLDAHERSAVQFVSPAVWPLAPAAGSRRKRARR